MTAIAGASAGVKDMADGSLRITIEFEPRDAKQAFELFGSRGTPVALAALKVGFEAVSSAPAEPAEKIGPLCMEAVKYCAMPEFQQWVGPQDGGPSEGWAKTRILQICQIGSGKELDTLRYAADLFRTEIRIPFMRYMKQRQAA